MSKKKSKSEVDDLLHISEESLSGTAREILLLRKKLEIRSWFLRFSLALNTGIVAALIFKILDK